MYIVLELQNNGENNLSVLNWTFSKKEEAEAKYYTVLSVAALSQVPIHGAMLLQEGFGLLEQKSYDRLGSHEE